MSRALVQLREIIARLRAPGGCPWDQEQTSLTLRSSLLEEAYEVVDAIARGHQADLEEELGDLLINILMQAEIASGHGSFTLDSIASSASEKLIRRHPHVFGNSSVDTSAAVLNQWEEIKRAERQTKDQNEGDTESLLDGVARAFPALIRAQKIQKKAAKAGFDWENQEDVVEKIQEELIEVEAEMSRKARGAANHRLAEEVGDLLFSVVNLARVLSIDSESALQDATDKFVERFRSMEAEMPNKDSFSKLSLSEMNILWEKAKTQKKHHEQPL